MDVHEREPGDAELLKRLIRRTEAGKQRDRYRMVMLALGGKQKLEIAAILGVAKSTVEYWVYRYRDAGIAALTPRKAPGARPKLAPEHHESFKARIRNGATHADGVCTLRGKDVQRILDQEYGVCCSLQAAYDLLHRLGFSCLRPRPRHEKNDPQQMEAFRASAPLFSGASRRRTRGRTSASS